jgi:hypothetical protein
MLPYIAYMDPMGYPLVSLQRASEAMAIESWLKFAH